jgi:hypothetical protein
MIYPGKINDLQIADGACEIADISNQCGLPGVDGFHVCWAISPCAKSKE